MPKVLSNVVTSLQDTIIAINEANERSIIKRLLLLGRDELLSGELDESDVANERFEHFNRELRVIVRYILNKTIDGGILWKVAEECYNEAIKRDGSLYMKDYFAPENTSGSELCAGHLRGRLFSTLPQAKDAHGRVSTLVSRLNFFLRSCSVLSMPAAGAPMADKSWHQ